MSLNHVQKAAILSRRCKVAELLLKGVNNLFEICRRLGMDTNQYRSIQRDIAAIKLDWRASAVKNFNDAVAAELAKIDLAEKEYWDAWHRSCAERQSTRTGRRSQQNGSQDFAEVKKEHRDGNPAFLDGVMKCITRRCELLGINAPKKFIHAGDEENPLSVKVELTEAAQKLRLEEMDEDQLEVLDALRNRAFGIARGLPDPPHARN